MKLKYIFTVIGLICLGNNAFAEQQISQDQLEMIQEKANQGDAKMQEIMGELYQSGHHGVEKDFFQAKKWYEKAVQQGNADAMNNLGNMYARGDGVPQDYNKALELRKKADSLGNVTATYNIALMYDIGNGVPKNISEAIKWYQKAANNGDGSAMNNLGAMYKYGRGVPTNITKAKEYFKQACLHESTKGCENYKNLNN